MQTTVNTVAQAAADMPKYVFYTEAKPHIDAYKEKATVKRVVVIDKAHYNDGYQWGFQGDTVLLSPEDAKALDRAGHTVEADGEDA